MKYINLDQLKDERENLRVINLINDDLNSKPLFGYTTSIDDTARDITGVPEYGSFIMIIYAVEGDAPTGIYALTKSNQTAVGTVTTIVSQVGVNAWAGNALSVTSTTSNFQVMHDKAGVSADFNITILGVF
jgi:hypothetical protein